ncbi:MAG: hypothetical protein WD738_18295 [Pirellulales bacterium]
MKQSEKMLAALVLALIAAWAGSSWYGKYQDTLASRRRALDDAKARLADVNLALAQGRSAVQQLAAWQERSLPNNGERAVSLYKAWLLAKAKDAGLAIEDLKPSPQTSASPAYKTIGYQMKATGPLSAVAAMLYEFYRSPQLQQITSLRLHRPVGESSLQVTLDVEALSLPGAVAVDSLPEGDAKRLKLASLEEYQKSLGERDFVSVYAPPQSPEDAAKQRESAPDDSERARFSATVPSAKGLQAWINIPTTGETLRLAAGDAVKVGKLEGEIVSVEPRTLVLRTGEKTFRVALGQTLRGGKELDGKGAAASDERSERRGSSPPG